MKKLAIVLLLVGAGCTRTVSRPSPQTGTNVAGAATPREAVNRFMAAAKIQDLQAMASIWGGPKGPASETMDKEALEMREVIMMRCLRHDTYTVLTETAAPNSDRVFVVELRLRNSSLRSNFTTTRGPKNRWYVLEVGLQALQNICTAK